MAFAYRIAQTRYANSIEEMMSGHGSFLHGGRWNGVGRRMIYMSESLSLAMLEILVHSNDKSLIPTYSYLQIEFNADLLLMPTPEELPQNWNEVAVEPLNAQAFGNYWFDQQGSAYLKVPSVVNPLEYNILANPLHPEFAYKPIGDIQSLDFDARSFA